MRVLLVLAGLTGAPLACGADPPTAPGERKTAAHVARREYVEALLRQAPAGGCDFAAGAAVVRRLADEAAAAGDPGAAVRRHERWATAVRGYEAKVDKALARGGTGAIGSEMLRAKDARVEAEVDLLRRRGGGGKELVTLLRERVELRAYAERVAEKRLAAGPGDREGCLEAKVARLDAEAELAAAEQAARKGGK